MLCGQEETSDMYWKIDMKGAGLVKFNKMIKFAGHFSSETWLPLPGG